MQQKILKILYFLPFFIFPYVFSAKMQFYKKDLFFRGGYGKIILTNKFEVQDEK